MTNQPVNLEQTTAITLPEVEGLPSVSVSFQKTQEGIARLVEAKYVNPSTYTELEFTYGEGYRECKTSLSNIGYFIARTEQAIRAIKSGYLLDEYPAFRKEKGLSDNAANRDAFLEAQEDYRNAVERLDQLKALETFVEGRVKIFENVTRYMRKQMDLIRNSGIDPNKYGAK